MNRRGNYTQHVGCFWIPTRLRFNGVLWWVRRIRAQGARIGNSRQPPNGALGCALDS